MANPKYAGLKRVGAGANDDEQVNPKPTLEGASEYEYVTLVNPLPFTFIGKVGQSRKVNAPIRVVSDGSTGINNEQDLQRMGLDLRNPDHPGVANVTSKVVIEPGQTINLRGDEAQVIIRQLTNELLAYEGQTLKIGAPPYRKQAEERIIQGRSTIEELIGGRPVSEREQIDHAIQEKNEEAFPDVEKEESKETPKPKKGK